MLIRSDGNIDIDVGMWGGGWGSGWIAALCLLEVRCWS